MTMAADFSAVRLSVQRQMCLTEQVFSLKAGVDMFVLDSAHGHSKNILKAVEKVKTAFPNITLMCR